MKTLVLICILVYQSLCEILPPKPGRISQISLDQTYPTTTTTTTTTSSSSLDQTYPTTTTTTTTTSSSSSKKGMTWQVAVWPS